MFWRCGLAAALLLLITAPASALIIDSFDTAASTTANSGTPTDTIITASGTFLGTNRNLESNWISGANAVVGGIDAGGSSLLNLSLRASTLGDVTVGWSGIGGADLTAGATLNAISLEVVFDDLPADITIQVFDGTFLGQSTITTAGGIFVSTIESLLFSSFSGTVDFTSVESITLIIEPLFPAANLQIGFIESASVPIIPEPSTALLLSLGLVGLGVRRRRA